MRDLQSRHALIGDVRGLGAFWAIETEATDPRRVTAVGNACRQRGLWPLVVGNRLHIAPPLNIAEADLREGLAILDDALAAAG